MPTPWLFIQSLLLQSSMAGPHTEPGEYIFRIWKIHTKKWQNCASIKLRNEWKMYPFKYYLASKIASSLIFIAKNPSKSRHFKFFYFSTRLQNCYYCSKCVHSHLSKLMNQVFSQVSLSQQSLVFFLRCLRRYHTELL